MNDTIPVSKGRRMTQPDFLLETDLIQSGSPVIAGVDEVGRGPLAGPVTAAAVILDPLNIPDGMNDSKKLSAKKREGLFDQIMATAQVSIVHVSVEEIDEINILQASLVGMVRAVDGLGQRPDHVLIDGNKIPKGLTIPATAVVKGDAKSLSIAAASIVAKITRDHLMHELANQFPGYGWEKNAGYPTKIHQEALVKLGVTPHHRRSFGPVHKILYQEK